MPQLAYSKWYPVLLTEYSRLHNQPMPHNPIIVIQYTVCHIPHFAQAKGIQSSPLNLTHTRKHMLHTSKLHRPHHIILFIATTSYFCYLCCNSVTIIDLPHFLFSWDWLQFLLDQGVFSLDWQCICIDQDVFSLDWDVSPLHACFH